VVYLGVGRLGGVCEGELMLGGVGTLEGVSYIEVGQQTSEGFLTV
jgi:hypothetical protein